MSWAMGATYRTTKLRMGPDARPSTRAHGGRLPHEADLKHHAVPHFAASAPDSKGDISDFAKPVPGMKIPGLARVGTPPAPGLDILAVTKHRVALAGAAIAWPA